MRKPIIITDSNCDIPDNILNNNIRVLPVNLLIGKEKEIYKETELDKNKFYKLMEMDVISTITESDIEDLANVALSIDKDVDSVIFLLSPEFYQKNLPIIQKLFPRILINNIVKRITVINSELTSMALGLLVLDCSKLIDELKPFNYIIDYILEHKKDYCFEFAVKDESNLFSHKIISKRRSNIVKNLGKTYIYGLNKKGLLIPIKSSTDAYNELVLRGLHNSKDELTFVRGYKMNNDFSEFDEKILANFGLGNTSTIGTNSFGLCYRKKSK